MLYESSGSYGLLYWNVVVFTLKGWNSSYHWSIVFKKNILQIAYSYWFKCVDTITSNYYMKLYVVRFQKVDLQQK